MRPLTCGAAVTYSAVFFGFYGFDERLVAAEAHPSIVVKTVFFLYGFFAQYVLGVPAAVGNEIVVILEAL